jgi:cell division protein FtsX
MSLSVFILSSVLFVKQNTNIIFGDASDLYTVNISVEKTQTPEKIEAILKQIQDVDLQQIKKVTLISSQEQITDVEKVLPAYSSGLFESEELEQILNPMIEVQLAPEANSTEIIEKIKAIPGISHVTFSADWIEKFRSLFSVANIILDTIFVLFFVILSFLIAILIRNYLISAKDSISVQALLGATPRQAFIKPYTQIMLSTLISYVIGLAVTFALALTIKQKISQNTDFSFINTRISFLNISNISIIALGLLLNLVISYWLSYHYINKEYYKHD